MLQSIVRLPVSFQCINTNLSVLGNVWMEYFCDKESLRRFTGEVFTEDEFDFEVSAGVGRARRAVDSGLNVRDVLLIREDLHALWWLFLKFG